MTAPTYDPTNVGNRPGEGPLRAGGVTVPATPTSDSNRPDRQSKAAKAQAADLEVMRDCYEGNSRIHEKGTTYLPQAAAEDPVNYATRLARSVFHNVVRNTIDGLVGYIFRTDPMLGDDVPAPIVAQWENIDNAGTHGDVFIRERGTDAMTAGHGAILVEYPATGGQQSAGEEARGEVRPYWVPILKENILSWRTTVEKGRTVLTQIVLKECTMVPDGAFGEREQKQYRVLYRNAVETPDGLMTEVGWRLLQVNDQNAVVEVGAGIYTTQTEIPIAEIVTTGKRSLFDSTPPFLDLAALNLAHYRQWSDYDTSIASTKPVYWEAGVDVEQVPQDGQPAPKLVLGPNAARRSTNPQFSVGFASHDAPALAEIRQSLADLKTAMAEMGLAALASSKRVAETATAKELDKSASDAALAVNARGLQDGVERALYFHARYLNLEDGGSIQINRDYGEQGMDASVMMAWATLAEKLGVPVRLVLERLQMAGEIPEGYDLDALEQEMVANQVANEARRMQEQMDAMQRLQAGGAGNMGAQTFGSYAGA